MVGLEDPSNDVRDTAAPPNNLSHIFYDAPVPIEIDERLSGLYHSAFCVKEFFVLFKESTGYQALAISSGGTLQHVICYSVKNCRISVLNELIEIEPHYLDYASAVLFREYPQARKIDFQRIKLDIRDVRSPLRIWSRSSDIVAQLPATIEAYDAKLGKSTKKTVKYHLNRLQRENPDFSFSVASSGEISPSLIERIIDLNKSRMESKQIRCGYDSARAKNVTEFAGRYGAVSSITINNQVVAGLICYDMGSHVFGETIAHDNAYNKSRIGQVVFYLTLRHFIEKGTRYYHMMEGDYDYKYSFLGVSHDQYSFSLYRSARHKFLDIPDLLAHRAGSMIKQLRYYSTVLRRAAGNRKFPVRSDS